MHVLWRSINSKAYTSGLSGPPGHQAEVLHLTTATFLKDLFDSVVNQNIVDFTCIKHDHFLLSTVVFVANILP